MTLLLMLLAPKSHAPDAFARYKAFMGAHPTYQVAVTSTLNNHPGATGTLTVQRPSHLLYRSQGPKANYSVSTTEAGYVEIERSTRTYDELPSTGDLNIYPSDISPAASMLVPRMLILPDLKGVFPKDATITKGAGSETIHASQQSQAGKVDIWATIDDQGRLTEFRRKMVGMGGTVDIDWHFSGFTFPQNLKLKSFLTPLPLGFSPWSLPRIYEPLQIGKKAPTNGWSAEGSTAKVDLVTVANHKPFLLAVLDASGPSASAMGALKSLKDRLPVFWTGTGGYSDHSGKLLAQLSAPASPMFYLIDGQGKVAKIWLGFDSSHQRAFETDVSKAAQEAANPKKP